MFNRDRAEGIAAYLKERGVDAKAVNPLASKETWEVVVFSEGKPVFTFDTEERYAGFDAGFTEGFAASQRGIK